MNFFGLEVPPLGIVQVAVTALAIFSYALFYSFNEAYSSAGARTQLILFLDFVLRNSPNKRTDEQFLGCSPQDVANPDSEIHWEINGFRRYQKDGSLPHPSEFKGTTLGEHLPVLLLPMVMAVGLLLVQNEERHHRVYALHDTNYRRDLVSKEFLLATSSMFYLFGIVALLQLDLPGWSRIVLYVLGGLVLAGLLLTFYIFLHTVINQVRWKRLWSDEFAAIMAAAARDNDHDLFNRALLLQREVSQQPDVPIPGTLGAYVVAYSLFQVSLAWLADRVAWL